jgi:predicted DNA-binding transcriptional regulator AlpA
MTDTLKAANEAFNSDKALEAVEDARGVAETNTASKPDDPPPALLPESAVCRRYGVSDTTLIRWERDESLGFPKPIYIRGRRYRRLSELEAFEERQARNPQVSRWTPRGCIGGDEAA